MGVAGGGVSYPSWEVLACRVAANIAGSLFEGAPAKRVRVSGSGRFSWCKRTVWGLGFSGTLSQASPDSSLASEGACIVGLCLSA